MEMSDRHAALVTVQNEHRLNMFTAHLAAMRDEHAGDRTNLRCAWTVTTFAFVCVIVTLLAFGLTSSDNVTKDAYVSAAAGCFPVYVAALWGEKRWFPPPALLALPAQPLQQPLLQVMPNLDDDSV